jgi:hypothetical protein
MPDEEEQNENQPSPIVAMASMVSILSGPDKTLEKVIQVGKAIAGTLAIPVEMGMRLNFGSEYQSPIMVICSVIVAHGWYGLTLLIRIFSYAIPEQYRPPSAPIGMGVVMLVYLAGLIYHAVRISKLMRNMPLEEDSEDDGTALPFMAALPKGTNWMRVRVWYEPAFIIVVVSVMWTFRIVDIYATVFIIFCAAMLCIKALLLSYESWHYIRAMKNREVRSERLRNIVTGKDDRQSFGGRAMPVATSPGDRAFVAAAMTGLQSEYAHLVKRQGVNGNA